MVPVMNNPAWKQLVTGEKALQSSHLAVNMLLTNTRLKYKKDPSASNVEQLAKYAQEFFVKYEKSFQAELKQLFG
jgi:hypothetical protein